MEENWLGVKEGEAKSSRLAVIAQSTSLNVSSEIPNE
jgi:hypothetical protein